MRVRQRLQVTIPIAALCVAVLCVLSMQLIARIQSYGKLINYVGIVRGGTQRLVKLELNGVPSDDILASLDEILLELTTGEGPIGLVRIDDDTYNQDLERLGRMWEDLKSKIAAVRTGGSREALLERSEAYFRLANDTVFAAETYSNRQTKALARLILAMVTAMALTWSFILLLYLRRMLRLESANRDLSDKAYTDQLTGAPNLEKFRITAQAIADERQGTPFAVFCVDIDNFKYYNDVFGTEYGDEILQEYAKLLWADMGQREVFCRLSTDNFLILRCYTEKAELLMRQEQVDRQIAHYALQTKGQQLFTMSCGICCAEDLNEEHQINGLIERANFARKTAKNKLLAHYVFYNESIRDKMLSEKAIENRMYIALENKEFVVFFQPKVSLQTEKIACAEALVRWITPDKGIIGPDEFIPIFEKNLFIARIDRYVLEEVCRWLRRWLDAGKTAVPVSVNVSRMQLYDPDFVRSYTDIKNRYNIPAGLLEVEFTESMVFENLDLLLRIIAALKREGFRCSLDDFGKGYSSLNLLRKLPVDVLKLDKLFFDEDDQLVKAHTIITGVVTMVRNLDIRIVAEGVEQEEQVQYLREIGCDLVQGYVFYRPMSISAFEELLTADLPAVARSCERFL